MINISENLLKNERILWQGKPARSPYVWNSMPMLTFISLLLGIFPSMVFISIIQDGGFATDPGLVLTAFMGPFFIIILLGWLVVESQYSSYEYFVTNQRIISCSGTLNKTMLALPKSQIIQTQITHSLADRIHGQKNTGSICLTFNTMTSQTYRQGQYGAYTALLPMNIVFSNIENPYEVLHLISNES